MYKFTILFFLSLILLFSSIAETTYLPEYNLFYSGEISMGMELDDDNKFLLDPDYFLYLQGEPYSHLFVIGYLKPEGELFDKILVDYNKNKYRIQYGDNTFQEMGGKFINFNQNQRGVNLEYSFLNKSMSLKAVRAYVKSLNYTEEIEGNGSNGPYFLSKTPIVPGSESIAREGRYLLEDEYKIDYQTGEIILLESLGRKEEIEVSYSYLPGGGYYERLLEGIAWTGEYSGNWGEVEGEAAWLLEKDNPIKSNSIIFEMPPRLLQARIIKINFDLFNLLKINNELANSNIKGPLNLKDNAYEGVLQLGNEKNHLQYTYTYQGPNFYKSLEEGKAEPLEADSLKGRWQVMPNIYLSGEMEYSHDNPEKRDELITSYEEKKTYKAYWQLSPYTYLQFVRQRKETGDDLIYLPLGQIISSTAVMYSYQNKHSFDIGFKKGKMLWKDPYSQHLNNNYYEVDGSLSWQDGSWDTEFYIDSKYIFQPQVKIEGPVSSEHYFNSIISYMIPAGRITYEREDELEADFTRKTQEFSIKKNITNNLQGKLRYEWDEEIYPDSNLKFEQEYGIGFIYYGPVSLSFDYNQGKNNNRYIQASLGWNKGKLKLNMIEDSEGKTMKLENELKLLPVLIIKPSLIYKRDKNKEKEFYLKLSGGYSLSRRIKIKIIGETDLLNPENNPQKTNFRAELIISF